MILNVRFTLFIIRVVVGNVDTRVEFLEVSAGEDILEGPTIHLDHLVECWRAFDNLQVSWVVEVGLLLVAQDDGDRQGYAFKNEVGERGGSYHAQV